MNQVNIGWDNGLSPIRRQTIISTNAGLLSIELFGTNFSDFLIKIKNFSFTKMRKKMSSAKGRPFCPGVDELMGRSVCIGILITNQEHVICDSMVLRGMSLTH